jgi:hypothetical protein
LPLEDPESLGNRFKGMNLRHRIKIPEIPHGLPGVRPDIEYNRNPSRFESPGKVVE